MPKTVDQTIQGKRQSFVLHADPAVSEAPRTQLVVAFLTWLAGLDHSAEYATRRLIQHLPPSAIHVVLKAREHLPGRRIGSFQVGSAASPARRWQVTLAYGATFDVHWGVEAWLATLSHELHHMAAFHENYEGKLPIDLHYSEFHSGIDAGDEAEIEELGNDVIREDFTFFGAQAFCTPNLMRGIEDYVEGHRPTLMRLA